MKTCFELVKSDVAGGAINTNRPLTTHLSKQGGAAMQSSEWRPVVGYEGFYEVSDQGQVRSLDRNIEQASRNGTVYTRFIFGQVMNPTVGNHGYPHVTLRRSGTSKLSVVHRLILEAFVGPCPDGMEACHDNDMKTDNRLVNLRWDTSKANKRDMIRNGGHYQASQTHCKHGHEFTPENTIARTGGGRGCRTGKRIHSQTDAERANHRERNRRYNAKRRAA
jgi:hypothetical protein